MFIMTRRDRNHPSCIIWSICNEVLCNTPAGQDWVAAALEMKSMARAVDPLGGRVVSVRPQAAFLLGCCSQQPIQLMNYR